MSPNIEENMHVEGLGAQGLVGEKQDRLESPISTLTGYPGSPKYELSAAQSRDETSTEVHRICFLIGSRNFSLGNTEKCMKTNLNVKFTVKLKGGNK